MTKFRLNRRYFWLGMALTVAFTAAATAIHPSAINGVFVLPWVLVHAGRLRDLGLRGAWAGYVIAAVLFALSTLAVVSPPPVIAGGMALAILLATFGFTAWLGVRRGQVDDNRFGPAPRGWRLGHAA